MKVSPINMLLACALLIISTAIIAVVRTRYQPPSTPPPQNVQSLRLLASATLPSPRAQSATLPLPQLQATALTAMPPPTQTSPATISTISTTDQYRLWMEEARVQYPYDEPLDTMWSVMLCESSGNADIVGDTYYGLFQYSSTTWSGDWNPYRDLPILDPRAQIFATAKAWYEGHQSWWGCYPA